MTVVVFFVHSLKTVYTLFSLFDSVEKYWLFLVENKLILHFPGKIIPPVLILGVIKWLTALTTDISSGKAGVFSYHASVIMSYSVNTNTTLHLGDAVPSHLLIGTTKHSCFFYPPSIAEIQITKNQFIPSSGSLNMHCTS